MPDYELLNFSDPIFAVKAIGDEQSNEIEGILVPFGSRVRRDMYGEFFTPETDIKSEWYTERPLLYGHGRVSRWNDNGSPGSEAIGVIKELTMQELGWWAKAELKKGSRYFSYIRDMIQRGAMFFSSGAIPGMVEVSKRGEIKMWPVIEGSLTPTPAEPRRTNVSMVKSIMFDMDIPFVDFPGSEDESQGEGSSSDKSQSEDSKDGQSQDEDSENGKSDKEVEEEEVLKDNKSQGEDSNNDESKDDASKDGKSKDDSTGGESEDSITQENQKDSEKESDNDEDDDDDDDENEEEEDDKKSNDASKDGKSQGEASEDDKSTSDSDKEMECNTFVYADGKEETYCYESDSYNEETKDKERNIIMNPQLQKFITDGARHAGFTVNKEGAESVAKEMQIYYKDITGSDKFTMSELTLMMHNDDFVAKAKEWFKANSENGSMDELTAIFGNSQNEASRDTKNIEEKPEKDDAENKDENPDNVGRGGESKSAAPDSAAGNTPSFARNFKERHKFDNLSSAEKSYYAHKMNDLHLAKYKMPWPGTDGFLEALEDGSKDFIDKYHNFMATGDNETGRVPGDAPIAVKHLEIIREKKNSHRGIKDNELNYTDNITQGSEWVPDLWQGELWGLMQSEAVVAGLIQVTPMPSNPYNIPLEGDDPIIYTAPETKNDDHLTNVGPLPASGIPTAKTQISAYKLGIRSNLSHEYEEDAIIQVIPNMLRKQRRAMYNGIDDVIMNSQSREASTAQENHLGHQMDAKHRYNTGIGNGIVTQTLWEDNSDTNKVVIPCGGGLPKLEVWRAAQGMIDEHYIAEEGDLVWLCTPRTRHVIQSTDKFLDAEIHSGKITGKFGDIQSIPITTTFQMKDRDSLGRINVTGITGELDTDKNNRGICVLLYRPYWTLGYRRRLQTWSLYDPVYDAYQAGAWIRVGMIRRDDVRTTSIAITDIRI